MAAIISRPRRFARATSSWNRLDERVSQASSAAQTLGLPPKLSCMSLFANFQVHSPGGPAPSTNARRSSPPQRPITTVWKTRCIACIRILCSRIMILSTKYSGEGSIRPERMVHHISVHCRAHHLVPTSDSAQIVTLRTARVALIAASVSVLVVLEPDSRWQVTNEEAALRRNARRRSLISELTYG